MDSHQKKIMEQAPKKDHKKALLIILFIICCITLTAHFIRADKQATLHNYSTDYFIENAIYQHENCGITTKTNKTFINYDLLGAAINDDGEFEFYIIADGQGYFIDERGNLSSSCSFQGVPIAISLAENKYGYYVSSYQKISSGDIRDLYVKRIFSDNAYRNRRMREYGGTHEKISFLNEAEQYFGIKLDKKSEFECRFCDKPRYFYEIIQNKEGENRNLYGIKEISKQGFTFYSDGTLERVGINSKSNYNRYFGKDDSTIIIKDDNNPSIVERFIIEDLKDYEMTAFSEYIEV